LSAREPDESSEAAAFFAGSPLGLAVFDRVRSILLAAGPVGMRTSKSQVAFRRARGFAWLWRPGRYLRRTDVEVVLSIALGRLDPSPRFKQVAHPTPAHWIHHLEVRALDDVDGEVEGWLREAAERAASARPLSDSVGRPAGTLGDPPASR
jgi:hypothetical protein